MKKKPAEKKDSSWGLIDWKDKRRLIEYLTGPEGHGLIQPEKMFIREHFFRTTARHTEVNYGESVNINLIDRDDLDPARARKYLVYLGVTEPLIEAWLLHYERRQELVGKYKDGKIIGNGNYRLIDLDNPSMFAETYYRLAGLTGEDLRAVLTPDEEARTKWEKRLADGGKTWAGVKLSLRTIEKVLFYMMPGLMGEGTLRKRLERLSTAPVDRRGSWCEKALDRPPVTLKR